MPAISPPQIWTRPPDHMVEMNQHQRHCQALTQRRNQQHKVRKCFSLITVVYTRGVSVTFDQSYMDGYSVWGTLTLIDNSQI